MKKLLSILLFVILLCGCTCNAAQKLTIPEASTVGGYEMTTDTISCTVIANGEYKYTRFHSNTDDMTVECYATPTETVILCIQNGSTMYYTETVEYPIRYNNPLKAVYDSLRELEFLLEEQTDTSFVYKAVKTEQVVDAQQIPYTVYTLQTQWTDGKTYTFKYYEYSDGAILISAEAPDEINPMLTENTPWVVDLDKSCIRNTNTDKEIAVAVLQISAGEALSPNGSNTQVTEKKTHIYAHVDSKTGKIAKLQYEGGADVNILYTADIQEPVITPDMTPMDSYTLQSAMMLIYTIESLLIA